MFGVGPGCWVAMRQVALVHPAALVLCNPSIPKGRDDVETPDVPMLILAGRHHAEAMPVAERLHAMCRRSQLAVVDAGGHDLLRAHPAEVASLLARWLPLALAKYQIFT